MSTRAIGCTLLLLLGACGGGVTEADLLSAGAEIDDLRAGLAAARERADRERERGDLLLSQLKEASVRFGELEAELAERTPAARDAELDGLRAEHAAERERVAALQDDLLTQMDLLVGARERLVEQESEVSRLGASLEDETDLREATARDLEREREEAGDRNSHAEMLREETVQLTVTVVRLEREVGELRAQRDEAREGASALAESLAADGPAEDAAIARLHVDLSAARHALGLAEEELARVQEERARSASEVAQLQRDLVDERTRRMEREEAWLDYVSFVGSMDLGSLLATGQFPIPVEVPAEASAPEPALDPAQVRAQRLRSELRALFTAEQVRGMDLFELGRVGEGWAGPAVFRLLDDEGRLAGGLYAERLSLEASRAGRTVTLVLTEGHESRGGTRHSFAGGVRRIVLRHVDPEDWIATAPELFPPGSLDDGVRLDDGSFDLGAVRSALNDRLRRDATGTVLELRRLAGVRDGVLRDVHLVDRDRAGGLVRDLIADRLTLVRNDGGVQLLMEGGVSIQDGRKAPFLDGRMRILLPLAEPSEWADAGLPVSSPPAAAGDPGA